MQTLLEIIKQAIANGDSAVYLLAGRPVTFKRGAAYHTDDSKILLPRDTERLMAEAYNMAGRMQPSLKNGCDDQFALSVPGFSRLRVTAFSQRNSCALAVRTLPFTLPEPETFHIPAEVMQLSHRTEGLILVCGPSESGKSTTLTCLLNAINRERACHILTLENPIEYLIPNKNSFLLQRELLLDTADIACGLRTAAALAPDVLYVSDADDRAAYPALLRTADTGCLVLAGLRAGSPASAILSILNNFTGGERRQNASLLSQVLQVLVFQRLEHGENGLTPVFHLIEPDRALRLSIESGDAATIRSALPDA